MIERLDRRIKLGTYVWICGTKCIVADIKYRIKIQVVPVEPKSNVEVGWFWYKKQDIQRFSNEGLKSWLKR